MTTPRFSIVIPTRERPHTLEHTLNTCLAQTGDFEIVVSDNWSGPQTRELVEAHRDSRIRYVRTPAMLAMTDSLEFAVQHARGEYVIIQGDDDGLLRHALPVIDQILKVTNAPVLRWESAVYNWPDLRNAHFWPDSLLLPLTQSGTGHALYALNSRDMIRAAANGDTSYSDLPVIYNAAIRRDLLDSLRARTGRVFKTRTPDVYAAFAVTALVDRYYSLRAPLGICGRSGASTGVARHFCKKGSPIDRDFRQLNEAAGLHLHPWVPDLPPLPSAVADAFLWAKAELFPDDTDVSLDRRRLVSQCLRETEVDSAEEWRDVQASCRQALADSPELLAWFESEYGELDYTTLPRPNRDHHWNRYGEGHLHLNAAGFGVRNIAAAADLCEQLLGYQQDGLAFSLQERDRVSTPLSELQEKETLIGHLHTACEELRRDAQEKDALIHRLHTACEDRVQDVRDHSVELNRCLAELAVKQSQLERQQQVISELTARLHESEQRGLKRWFSARVLGRLVT